MNNQKTLNYSFTINSSIGPYVRFIIYRAYDDKGNLLKIDKDTQTRWYLNDFIVNADYEKMEYFDNYNQIYPFIKVPGMIIILQINILKSSLIF